MIEQQRLQYLSSLGIDTYVPRRVLANAAVSPLLVPFEPVEDLALIEEQAVEDAPEAQAAPVTIEHAEVTEVEPIAEDAALLEEELPENPVTKLTPAPTRAKAPLRFTLSLWEIAPQLIVIDTRQTGSALPTDKLLQNILRAVGYPLAQLPRSELIRWPIFKEDPQANNLEEAEAMVQANINARCSKTEGISFLVMGQMAADLVLSPCEPYANFEDHVGQRFEHAPWQAALIVLPSLIELLEAPLKKGLVWQALQPLLASRSSVDH